MWKEIYKNQKSDLQFEQNNGSSISDCNTSIVKKKEKSKPKMRLEIPSL